MEENGGRMRKEKECKNGGEIGKSQDQKGREREIIRNKKASYMIFVISQQEAEKEKDSRIERFRDL